MSANTRPILHRHSAATWPILYLHSPTLGSFAQLSILGSIFSTQLSGTFSGRLPFLAFNSGNIQFFFPAMFFFSSSLLYTTLVTSGSSTSWGSLLTEVRYFRGAKNYIKKVARLRSLSATWMVFSALDPVIFHNSSWRKQYLPLL